MRTEKTRIRIHEIMIVISVNWYTFNDTSSASLFWFNCTNDFKSERKNYQRARDVKMTSY